MLAGGCGRRLHHFDDRLELIFSITYLLNNHFFPQAIADGVVGDPISAILQSRDPSPPPFSYVKGGGGLFKVRRRGEWATDAEEATVSP